MPRNGTSKAAEADIDIGGWSGSVTNSKSTRGSMNNDNHHPSCGKCGAGGFDSNMMLRMHEKNCDKESDTESLSSSGKENPSRSRGRSARSNKTSMSRNRSKSKSRVGRSRSPLRSIMQRARSRSPPGLSTARGVSFMRGDRTPKRTGRGGTAAGFMSPASDASTPCISNKGISHITSSFSDALEGRPSAVDLIPELGMGGAMASLASRCVAVESICPRAGIDEAVAEYRRKVLGVTDRSFRAMKLEDYNNIPLS